MTKPDSLETLAPGKLDKFVVWAIERISRTPGIARLPVITRRQERDCREYSDTAYQQSGTKR
jgi:hypothetical protein